MLTLETTNDKTMQCCYNLIIKLISVLINSTINSPCHSIFDQYVLVNQQGNQNSMPFSRTYLQWWLPIQWAERVCWLSYMYVLFFSTVSQILWWKLGCLYTIRFSSFVIARIPSPFCVMLSSSAAPFFSLRLQCPGCPPILCISLTHSHFLLIEMVGHQTTGSPSLGLFCTYSDVYMSVCSCLKDCDFQFCWKPAEHSFVILYPSCLNDLGTRMFIV